MFHVKIYLTLYLPRYERDIGKKSKLIFLYLYKYLRSFGTQMDHSCAAGGQIDKSRTLSIFIRNIYY